jgi:predicted dienelactone hydrolase
MITTDVRHLVDPARKAWDGSGGRPVRVHLWEPAEASAVVLLSHGTGGAVQDLSWLAGPLAEAGFLVAGIDHHGNNYLDGYRPEAFACWWDRPRDLSFALDHLAATRRLGPVGAAGFSIGGYTVAALLGARVDAYAYRALATGEVSAPPTPEYPNLLAELRARVPDDELADWATTAGGDHRDARVRAGLLMSPALGPMITADSLAGIRRPVDVWWAGADEIAPPPENAQRYAALIPGATGHDAGAALGHYAFLDNDPAGAPMRSRLAAAATTYFDTHLR